MSFIKSIFNLLRFNKKNWKAVVLCLFAATVFWFFNALNKTYTTNITFPLAFDFNESNYVAVKPLPGEVRINVTGIGWGLFRRSIGVKIPSLIIPLERPSEVKKIVGSTLPGLFSNQLEGFEINFVLTDTLYLNIQPQAGRWVKIGLNPIHESLRKNYTQVGDIRIIPDSIFVQGPMGSITKLREPVLITIDQQNIDENFRGDVEVAFPEDQYIRRNPPTVAVAFDVEKLVEREGSIPLEIINAPSGAKTFLESKYVSCIVSIRESMIADFSTDSLKAVLDLSELGRGEKKLIPHIVGLPENSRVIFLDSVKVKF